MMSNFLNDLFRSLFSAPFWPKIFSEKTSAKHTASCSLNKREYIFGIDNSNENEFYLIIGAYYGASGESFHTVFKKEQTMYVFQKKPEELKDGKIIR